MRLKVMNKTVKVKDRMQKGYEYFLTEPTGKNFHLDFKPELTPKQMLNCGKPFYTGHMTAGGFENIRRII